MAPKQKFATQVDPILLAKTREIAQREGRNLQSVVEEALADLVEKKATDRSRPEVVAHYEATVTQFDRLLDRLAK
jgi:hypothetical protein